jgi:hypothetical protein
MDPVSTGVVGGGGDATPFVSFAERFRRGFVLEGAARVAGAVVYDEPAGGGRTEHFLRNGVDAARLRPVGREAKKCVQVERRTGVACMRADPRAAAAAFPGAAAVWLDGVEDPEGVAERAMKAMARGGCLVLGCCVPEGDGLRDLADGRERVRDAMRAAGAEEVMVDRIRAAGEGRVGGGTVVVVVGCGVAAGGTHRADEGGEGARPMRVGQRVRHMGRSAVVESVDAETGLVEVREAGGGGEDASTVFAAMDEVEEEEEEGGGDERVHGEESEGGEESAAETEEEEEEEEGEEDLVEEDNPAAGTEEEEEEDDEGSVSAHHVVELDRQATAPSPRKERFLMRYRVERGARARPGKQLMADVVGIGFGSDIPGVRAGNAWIRERFADEMARGDVEEARPHNKVAFKGFASRPASPQSTETEDGERDGEEAMPSGEGREGSGAGVEAGGRGETEGGAEAEGGAEGGEAGIEGGGESTAREGLVGTLVRVLHADEVLLVERRASRFAAMASDTTYHLRRADGRLFGPPYALKREGERGVGSHYLPATEAEREAFAEERERHRTEGTFVHAPCETQDRRPLPALGCRASLPSSSSSPPAKRPRQASLFHPPPTFFVDDSAPQAGSLWMATREWKKKGRQGEDDDEGRCVRCVVRAVSVRSGKRTAEESLLLAGKDSNWVPTREHVQSRSIASSLPHNPSSTPLRFLRENARAVLDAYLATRLPSSVQACAMEEEDEDVMVCDLSAARDLHLVHTTDEKQGVEKGVASMALAGGR